MQTKEQLFNEINTKITELFGTNYKISQFNPVVHGVDTITLKTYLGQPNVPFKGYYDVQNEKGQYLYDKCMIEFHSYGIHVYSFNHYTPNSVNVEQKIFTYDEIEIPGNYKPSLYQFTKFDKVLEFIEKHL